VAAALPSPAPGLVVRAAPVVPAPAGVLAVSVVAGVQVGAGVAQRCTVRALTPQARATCPEVRPAASNTRPTRARSRAAARTVSPGRKPSPARPSIDTDVAAETGAVRRNMRRSCSVNPPQMPYGIRAASARHSARTGHPTHTAFAAATCAVRAGPDSAARKTTPGRRSPGTRRAARHPPHRGFALLVVADH